MRLLVSFEESSKAETLQNALYVLDIESSIREGNGGLGVWVHDDEDIDDAKEILRQYEMNPTDERFQSATKTADKKRREFRKSEEAVRKRTEKAEKQFAQHKKEQRTRSVSMTIGGLTMFLIGICGVVAFFTGLGDDLSRIDPLRYSLPLILNGEAWRVVTPIFVHFGLMHLVFNVWWLKDLGTAIERIHSSVYLAVFVLLTGALSNTAQYFVSGPNFGGMSGVVYALFGFFWIRGRFDPRYPFRMPKQTVWFMMGWFLLCFTGLMGSVANAAHAGGLVSGALWGQISAFAKKKS